VIVLQLMQKIWLQWLPRDEVVDREHRINQAEQAVQATRHR
jgi:hypothetical protein